MSNDQTTAPSGQIAPEAIAELQQKYPRGIQEVRVTTVSQEVVIGYVKKPDRNLVGIALAKTTKGDLLGAGEFLLQNCWLTGDSRMNPSSEAADDDIIIAASLTVAKGVEVLDAEIKKL